VGLAADRRRLEAAYRAEIEAAPDPAAKRAEIEQRIRKFASPLRGAERYDIEEIIDPRDTRKLLCEFAELAAPLRTRGAVPSACGREMTKSSHPCALSRKRLVWQDNGSNFA